MNRFFRTSPQVYAQLQPAVDEAFRKDWIDTGKCEHILPLSLPVQKDGLCYIALAEWMTAHPDAVGFLASVQEVDAKTYEDATRVEELP